MFEKLKANILFEKLLKRPDINKAYALVGPENSWYDTLNKVHESLAQIQKLPHEILEITSHDGLKLQAVYYPGTSGKTAIWVHGYTSHAERESAFPGLFYHGLGYNVLIPYQRAHGLSQGKYITFGALEHLDMLRWVEKVNEMHPDGSILLHGLSMGGGIVLDLCDKEMANVKCLIADAPNESIEAFLKDVTHSVFKKDGPKVYPEVLVRYEKEFSADPLVFDRVKNVTSCQYPILLSAGENEKREDLFRTITDLNPMQTETVILPGCDHGNGMYKQTEMYQSAIKAFLQKNMDT